jgi:cyclic lactone autoinducer peptide
MLKKLACVALLAATMGGCVCIPCGGYYHEHRVYEYGGWHR